MGTSIRDQAPEPQNPLMDKIPLAAGLGCRVASDGLYIMVSYPSHLLFYTTDPRYQLARQGVTPYK